MVLGGVQPSPPEVTLHSVSPSPLPLRIHRTLVHVDDHQSISSRTSERAENARKSAAPELGSWTPRGFNTPTDDDPLGYDSSLTTNQLLIPKQKNRNSNAYSVCARDRVCDKILELMVLVHPKTKKKQSLPSCGFDVLVKNTKSL